MARLQRLRTGSIPHVFDRITFRPDTPDPMDRTAPSKATSSGSSSPPKMKSPHRVPPDFINSRRSDICWTLICFSRSAGMADKFVAYMLLMSLR